MVEWKLIVPVVLTEKHVILGLYYDPTHFSAINYVILLGKCTFTDKQWIKNDIFKLFLKWTKFKLDIEKTICETSNTHTHFSTRNVPLSWTHFNFVISQSSNQIVLIYRCLFKHAYEYNWCLSMWTEYHVIRHYLTEYSSNCI